MSVELPALHEREEYLKMRDILADFLARETSLDPERAKQLASKITPAMYVSVEQQCVQWHLNSVHGARGMLVALQRIEQLDGIRFAVSKWADRIKLVPEDMRTMSERALLTAYDKYLETRAKDN